VSAALVYRTGRDLHAGGDEVFRVSGRRRAVLAELLDVVHLHAKRYGNQVSQD
jgi:hypothetical protein